MSKNVGERKQELLKALGDCSGILKDALEQAGISDALYRYWRKKDVEFSMQCDIIIQTHQSVRDERKAAEKALKEEAEREQREQRERARAIKREARKLERERRMKQDNGAGEPRGLDPFSGPVSMEDYRREHVEALRMALEARGVSAAGLYPQIEATATLYASFRVLSDTAAEYSALQIEYSREGDPRASVFPFHAELRRAYEAYTSGLKALGLNFNATVKPTEQDQFGDFMAAMRRED